MRSPRRLSLRTWWNKVRTYKQYLALILVPYLFLILIFHTQLTVYDGRGKEDDQDVDGVNSIFAADSNMNRDNLEREADIGNYYHNEQANVNRRVTRLADERLHHANSRHHALRFSPHQRKNLGVALAEPVDEADERIPIPQITAEQPGSKGRSLGALDSKKQEQQGNIAVYDIDWDTQQSNYLDNVADLEPEEPHKDNRIELTWKHSSWVSNNKTLNKGTHDGIMMEHCLKNDGPAGKGLYPENGTARGHLLTDHSKFQPLLNSFVYTAFYDDRQSGLAYVHIILLLKKIEKPAVYCHFPSMHHNPGDKGSGPKYVTVKANYYEMCENHGKDYGGWIAQCEVPSVLGRLPPCEVTLSIHRTYPLKHKLKSDKNKSVNIPIYVLQNPDVKPLNFGVCVPPLFGYIPTTTLIEYIELTKLLGAQHLTFYAHQIPREVQKVLHYYEDKGDITVINWDLPVDNKDIWYHGQLLAINDCLNRNMHKFQYLAFNDIDEFIVPHHGKHLNWTQMITNIANVSRDIPAGLHAGYVFQSAFFDPLMDLNTRGLYDLESDLRTKAFSKVRTKVLVHAKRIYELGIHHISRPVNERYKIIDIEPTVAFLHHYRKCVTDFDPRMNCQVFARDESLSRYIPTLRHNVHQVLWTLKEADKKLLGDVFVR